MSFQKLTDTVRQSFDMSDDEVFDCLSRLAQVAGKNYFTRRTLESAGIQQADNWVRILSTCGQVKTLHEYTCMTWGQSELTEDNASRCVYCNNTISEMDLKHEIKEMYIFTDEFHREYSEYEDDYYKEYLLEDYLPHLNELVRVKHHVIPFIGAGLGLPVGLPDWRGLLGELSPYIRKENQPRYKNFMDRGDLLEGIEYLKLYSATMKIDDSIKRFLSTLITEKAERYLRKPHLNQNYKDLIAFNPSFYLTTNYDNVLPTLIGQSTGKYVHQTTLDGISDFQQQLFKHSSGVVHVHGRTSDYRTMVITKDDYKRLYENSTYTDGLKYLMVNKFLLFIGFSFSDVFFGQVYREMKNVVNGIHYAVVADPDDYDARKYASDNLSIIGLQIRKGIDEDIAREEYGRRYIRSIEVMFKYIETH